MWLAAKKITICHVFLQHVKILFFNVNNNFKFSEVGVLTFLNFILSERRSICLFLRSTTPNTRFRPYR